MKKMKINYILPVLICFAVLLAACGQLPAESTEEIAGSEASYEKNQENESLVIAYPAPTSGGITLPETIPNSLISALEATLNSKPYACSIYYYDITTGFTIKFDSNRQFKAASLLKLPYMYYIHDMIDNGELSLEQEMTYIASRHKYAGTGSIKNMPSGTVLTMEQVIEKVIIESDNTGFKMFYNSGDSKIPTLSVFGSKVKKDFNMNINGSAGYSLHSEGVGRILTEIYAKSLEKQLYSDLIELLKQANENKFIKFGLPKDENGEYKYEVAHKYGMDIGASNDAAIVFYENRPYVLVVLTDYLPDMPSQSFMINVSRNIFNIHEYICKN